MNIFERLLETRKRSGLSQGDFAKRVGVGKSTQIRYEKGEVWPAVDYLLKVADAFDKECDYEWLVTGHVMSGAERLSVATATVLTKLYRSIGLSDDVIQMVREACQSGDESWANLLHAEMQRAGVSHLNADEQELLDNYRQASAEGKLAIRMSASGIAVQSGKSNRG